MSHVGKLATALTVVFLVSLLIIAAELLYLLFRRRRRTRRFFCFETRTRVEPSSGPPTQDADPDDAVIDVFKLLEASGPSRVLCTIKEDDREDVESVEYVAAPDQRVSSLQECLESEAATTVFSSSSPCDSPLFFTPVGSPARDGVVSPAKSSCGR